MAEKPEVVNAGEQISTPPPALPLKTDEQFRLINQRLDRLAGEVERVSKPPHFRIADVIELVAIVVGLAFTGIAAFQLGDRISELSRHQDQAEQRLDQGMIAMEQRLGSKLDRLSDQFTSMDERTARLEGEKSIATNKPK
jgi:hypothetical protein